VEEEDVVVVEDRDVEEVRPLGGKKTKMPPYPSREREREREREMCVCVCTFLFLLLSL
jgi:hypothetical protein